MYDYKDANQGNNMIFHMISQDILDWMQQYPEVKEESITDRLLYDSQKSRRFFAKAFTRTEEAGNGADWEWWVIVNWGSEVFAYRFLIQAKKIKKGTRDCYNSFNYKKGTQLQSLLKASNLRKAMPLYMVYSVEEQNFTQIYDDCTNECIRDILLSCKNCKNGAYLTPAHYVEELLKKTSGKSVDIEEVLNKALKLSILDCLMPVENHHLYNISRALRRKFYYPGEMFDFSAEIMRIMARYLYRKWWAKDDYDQEHKDNKIPFRYSIEEIPNYVRTIMDKKEREYEQWFEKEYEKQLEGLAGVAILDLRRLEDKRQE